MTPGSGKGYGYNRANDFQFSSDSSSDESKEEGADHEDTEPEPENTLKENTLKLEALLCKQPQIPMLQAFAQAFGRESSGKVGKGKQKIDKGKTEKQQVSPSQPPRGKGFSHKPKNKF